MMRLHHDHHASRAATSVLACVILVDFHAHADCVSILVPAYQYPDDGDTWARLAALPPGSDVGVIVNPDDGPGTSLDTTFAAAVNAARTAGRKLYGYIETDEGAKPLAQVQLEVSRHLAWYGPLDGIFLDEMLAETPANLTYYKNLTSTIHSMMPGSTVIGNPGTAVPQSFFAQNAADIIFTFENPVNDPEEPYSTAVDPPWANGYPASRFGHMILNVPTAAAMQQTLALALSRHVGVIYISSDTPDNEYLQLPSYFEQEVHFCPADLDNGSGTGRCNGGVDISDLLFFLSAYEAGNADADLANSSGQPMPDGGIDVNDLLFFLAHFESGC